jgi:hypothetical protein
MATEDPRSVLSAIAYGDDPNVLPADRVRAIDSLRELDRQDDPLDREFYRVLQGIPDDGLDAFCDGFLDADADEVERIVDGTSTRHPNLSRAVRAELQRQVDALADREARRAEIEARAQRLAERMYATRSFRLVDGRGNVQDAPIASGAATDPPERESAPSGRRAEVAEQQARRRAGIEPEVLARQERTFRPLAEPDTVRISADEFKRRLDER